MIASTTPVPSYQTLQATPSHTVANLTYIMSTDASGRSVCSCRDFLYRGHLRPCKHLMAISMPVPVVVVPVHSTNCDLYGFTGDCAVCS